MNTFSDSDAVAKYAEQPVRLVPGFAAMQQMAGLLLAERMGAKADVLVLGAGGGLELKAFAEANPGWRFVGVDPSAEMLDLAGKTLGSLASRVELCRGYVDDAPDGPFDGATCLLTMHFVPREARVATLEQLRRRLKPGAPLIVAHHSFPQDDKVKALWLSRYAAFAALSGVPADKAGQAAKAIGVQLPVLSPADDEAALVAAGFADVSLFYAGFTFRGWVAFAP